MLTIKVPLHDAEKVKKELIETSRFAAGYRIEKEDDHLYFPVQERFTSPYAFAERDLTARKGIKPTLRDALAAKLPADVTEQVKTAYDQVGDIAILEIDEGLAAYEQRIGEILLSINDKINTVLAKDASHEGTFRTQKMRLLAGEDKRKALHKENGVTLEVNVEEVYFSARLSTERKRIMELVTPGERVLVLFSGCGPYTCVLAKNTDAASVVGVEINPAGHQLAEANIVRNKLKNASTYCGDAREVVPRLIADGTRYDRICMPLPKSAETFLDVALSALTDGGVVHFYAFLHQDKFSEAHTWIREACAAAGKSCDIQDTVKCGQQAPYVFRICVDFTASRNSSLFLSPSSD